MFSYFLTTQLKEIIFFKNYFQKIYLNDIYPDYLRETIFWVKLVSPLKHKLHFLAEKYNVGFSLPSSNINKSLSDLNYLHHPLLQLKTKVLTFQYFTHLIFYFFNNQF